MGELRGIAAALGLALGLSVAACSGSTSTPASTPESDAPESTPSKAAEAEAVIAEVAEPAPTEPEVAEPPPPVEDPWLKGLLEDSGRFRTVLADPARYRVQILVTVIAPTKGGPPTVVEHPYRVDAEYVYPASAIKTFAAVGALRRLAELREQGHRVGLETPLVYCDDGRKRCTIDSDESNVEGGTITVGHEIRKMQLVSNNVAFNRLYELVGHRELNETMWSLGFPSVRIQHRMYGKQDPLVQRTTPRIELHPATGKTVVIPERVSDLEMPPVDFRELALGVAYIDDESGERVDEPLDFGPKNYVSIRDLHRLTLAIARPELPGVPDLGLSRRHRAHLMASMTDNPGESANPAYPELDKPLKYKTMIGGMQQELPLERIRYVGKAGRAYGFHLDNAYVEDTKTKRAMVVTVVVYANANGVLNDNVYEYDGITRPLLKNLGRALARAVLVEGGGT